jgi:cardiolipin synthase
MAAQYEIDLTHATEIVLTSQHRVRLAQARAEPAAPAGAIGSAGRVAAGAVSVGSALGAALTNRRALDAAESGLLMKVSSSRSDSRSLPLLWPQAIAWPLAVSAAWVGIAWVIKASPFASERERDACPIPTRSSPSAVAGGRVA